MSPPPTYARQISPVAEQEDEGTEAATAPLELLKEPSSCQGEHRIRSVLSPLSVLGAFTMSSRASFIGHVMLSRPSCASRAARAARLPSLFAARTRRRSD